MMEYHCLTRMSVKPNYLCRVGGLMHPDNLHVVADLALLNDEGFRADVEIHRGRIPQMQLLSSRSSRSHVHLTQHAVLKASGIEKKRRELTAIFWRPLHHGFHPSASTGLLLFK